MQQLEIGKIYSGKVKSIAQYGAFVDIDGGGTGMVHISEIANTYVNQIKDFLTEEQEVKVKVIGINENGKVSLSIKKAVETPPTNQNSQSNQNGNRNKKNNSHNNGGNSKPNVYEPKKQIPQEEMTFEDMLNRFKQNSEERMCDIKRNNERKNGSRRK